MVYEIRTTETGDNLLCAIESILAYNGRFLDNRTKEKEATRFGSDTFDIQYALVNYLSRQRAMKFLKMDVVFPEPGMNIEANRELVWSHLRRHLHLGKQSIMSAIYRGMPHVLALLAYDTERDQVLVNCCYRGLIYLGRDDLMCDPEPPMSAPIGYVSSVWYGDDATYVWR